MDGRELPAHADCVELNRRYGAPERIVFRPSRHGVPIVVLANRYGSAEVALFGAQTLSYRPTGNPPVLYMPHPYDETPAGEEIHGGIPVCWPWFARCGGEGAKPHGLARYSTWQVRGTEYSEDLTEIRLGLTSSDETRAVWPHDFDLELSVSVSMKLTLCLTAKNTGDAPFKVTEGFHPYLLVKGREGVSVRGVDGCAFFDTRAPEKGGERVWTGDYAPIADGSKVFTVEKHEHVLLDPGLHRAIALVSRGNKKLVVWNPGPESAGRVAELGERGWDRFVCVEPATIYEDAALELAPGEEHKLVMAIQSVPEGANYQETKT